MIVSYVTDALVVGEDHDDVGLLEGCCLGCCLGDEEMEDDDGGCWGGHLLIQNGNDLIETALNHDAVENFLKISITK